MTSNSVKARISQCCQNKAHTHAVSASPHRSEHVSESNPSHSHTPRLARLVSHVFAHHALNSLTSHHNTPRHTTTHETTTHRTSHHTTPHLTSTASPLLLLSHRCAPAHCRHLSATPPLRHALVRHSTRRPSTTPPSHPPARTSSPQLYHLHHRHNSHSSHFSRRHNRRSRLNQRSRYRRGIRQLRHHRHSHHRFRHCTASATATAATASVDKPTSPFLPPTRRTSICPPCQLSKRQRC